MTLRIVSAKTCVLYLCGAMLGSAQNQSEQKQSAPIRQASAFRRLADKGTLGSENKKPSRVFSGPPHIAATLNGTRNRAAQRPPVNQPDGPQAKNLPVVLRNLHKADFQAFDQNLRGSRASGRSSAAGASDVGDPRAYMISPPDGSALSPTQTFTWSAGRGVQDYALWIGSCYDCTDILDEDEGYGLSRTVNLPTDGRIVYVTLFSFAGGYWYWVDYEFVASSPVVPASLISPGFGSTLGNPQQFTWSLGYNVSDVQITVGTCFQCGDLLQEDEGLGSSRTLNLPTNGNTIFLTLYSYGNDGNWYWFDYQFRAASHDPVRVYVTNDFLYSINLYVGGNLIGSVDPANTQYFDSNAIPLSISFELVQPTVGGRSVGDTVAGYWDQIDNPSGTYSLEAGYKLGATYYFLPEISNHTGAALEIEVNGGYSSENRCNCFAPAYTDNVRAGYYQLFNNSNVRLFLEGNNYSGPYIWFGTDSNGSQSPGGPLYNFVQSPSGLIDLTATFIP